jgi:predicted amidohydrolase YtcJ
MHADMILINGNIITMDTKKPKAQAIAILKDKIIAVGTNDQIKKLRGKATKIIDLKGKTVVPGFTDTHVHMLGFGASLTSLNLRGVTSIEEMQQKLQEQVKKTPEEKWILGSRWDQEKFKEKRYPTRFDLDKIAPKNPVFLRRVCGHACVVNTKALQIAGITKRTKPPKGGEIDVDPKTSELTGILRENAVDLIEKAIPKLNEEGLEQTCLLACQKAIEEGLTTVHWIIESPTEIRIIQKLRANEKLPIRIYFMIPVEFMKHLTDLGLQTGFGDNMIKIGSIKILTDGSLGARTAALTEPYSDEPKTKGMTLYTQEELNRLFAKAHEANLQLAIHAIGDQAVDMTLKAIEKALAKNPRKNLRHRIEHASVLNEKLIDRIKKLNLIASVQPHFIISDFWIINRLGPKRARWAYPFKTLMHKGILTTGSSDCPVEPISPLLGIYAAVTRNDNLEERITVNEASQMYTINAAFASFEENVKGSIEVDKLADLTVLSRDPEKIALEEVKNIEVDTTIVGGKIVYAKTA